MAGPVLVRFYDDKKERLASNPIFYTAGTAGGLGWVDQWGPDPRHDCVIAHEIGHNIGTRHDSFGTVEYGSPFTVMGHGKLPEAHMYGASKQLFEWMDYSRVETIGNVDNANCKASQWCKTMDYDEPLRLKLAPVDQPVDHLPEDSFALVKIPLDGKPNYAYYLEWR